MKAVILAAGQGERLGISLPKAILSVGAGHGKIIDRQVKLLTKHMRPQDIVVVVGYKKELIMDSHSELTYVFNHKYDCTNTGKSLLTGLLRTEGEDTIWVNGDLFFDADSLDCVVRCGTSCMAVNTASVGDEEVKYITDRNGRIVKVSKHVESPLGEAIGLNKLIDRDWQALVDALTSIDDKDYFEQGVELILSSNPFYPIVVNAKACIEIDFMEDLLRVFRATGSSFTNKG